MRGAGSRFVFLTGNFAFHQENGRFCLTRTARPIPGHNGTYTPISTLDALITALT
jgi:hypothetical protein